MAVQYFLLEVLMKNTPSQHHQRAKIHFYEHLRIASKEGAHIQSNEIEDAVKPVFMAAVCSFHFCFIHSIREPDAHAFAALSNADQ